MTENPRATSDNASSAATRLAEEIKRRQPQAVSYSRQYVSLAERPGANLPSQALVRALDAALKAEGALLALHAQAGAEQQARRSALRNLPPHAGVDIALRPEVANESTVRGSSHVTDGSHTEPEQENMRRRDMLSLTGGAIAGTLLSPMEHTRRFVDSALKMPTSELDADEWENVADEYSRLVGRNVPISSVLPQLLADFDEILARIEMVPEALRGRLVRVAAFLSALIAISLLCANRRLESNRYWRTAQRAADSTGDRQLSSLIRGRRAVYELYQEAGSRAILNLADTALELAGDRASAGNASARAARAQVLAKNGAGGAAREALQELERDFDQLPESVLTNDPSLWGWSEQRLRFVQSFVHSYAGNTAEATAAQDAALALYPRTAYRGPTQIQFHRAIAMAVDGDQLGGAQYVLTALEAVPANLRSDQMIYQPASFALDTVSDPRVRVSAMTNAQELAAFRMEVS